MARSVAVPWSWTAISAVRRYTMCSTRPGVLDSAKFCAGEVSLADAIRSGP